MGVVNVIDIASRELTMFAAVMLLVGGMDDLAVDLVYLARRVRHGPPAAFRLEPPARPGRMAMFVAAWQEAGVIGRMLTLALGRLQHANFRIYVGCYPNDPATVEAVAAVAERDHRVRLVIGGEAGPTTKAGNLNCLWRAMLRADMAEGEQTRAVILHDAEDMLHGEEIGVFDALIGVADVVQIPVIPEIPWKGWVGAHYADEFAESHGRQMLVRTALRAGMPLAGTGCAIAVPMLERIAALRGGDPFDAASLTEDYELGLRIAELGGRSSFVRALGADGQLVAVRAYFPNGFAASVRQKARWVTGIALAGWDRTGWARPRALSDHWMRMRDRRAPLAMIVLIAAYAALVAWAASVAAHRLTGTPAAVTLPVWLVVVNSGLLGWRLVMRALATAGVYGWRQGLWSVPRFLGTNVIMLMAARRAMLTYLRLLRGQPLVWDKTQHVFPEMAEAGP